MSSHKAIGVVGKNKLPSGRFKSMVLTIEEYNHRAAQKARAEGKQYLNATAKRQALAADLLVVAVGGSAVEDAFFKETLGFKTDKLEAESYALYGVYKKQMGTALDRSAALAKLGLPVAVSTADSQYLLFNLKGISATDFDRLKKNADLRRRFMAAAGTAYQNSTMGALKDDAKAVGAFEVKIKRARHSISPNFPAIVVGDAAATPHPSAGTGILTGFHGFECFQELLTSLKKVHRSNDENVTDALYHFEDSYEIWLAAKSLEGTVETLGFLIAQASSFEEHLDQSYGATTDTKVKQALLLQSVDAFLLRIEMEEQRDRALLLASELLEHTNTRSGAGVSYSVKKTMAMGTLSATIDNALKTNAPAFKLNARDSVKHLWADMEETNKQLLLQTRTFSPLDAALQALEQEMAGKKAAKAAPVTK